MNILIAGYSGFIGGRLLAALVAAGHAVTCAGRKPPSTHERLRFVAKDFTRDVEPSAWLPHLAGIDLVINAAGIIGGRGAADLELVHARGPNALFDACVTTGVSRVIQLSALGADAGAHSMFHISKRKADEHLRGLPLGAVIVQPSLVYGRGGASAALFGALASAPFTALPGSGSQLVQPVHVDDVVRGILVIVNTPNVRDTTIPFVGPQPLTLRDFLAALRRALGLGRPRFIRIPLPIVRLAARFGAWTHRGLLHTETLDMLMRGNTGDPTKLKEVLGRPPRGVDEFVEPSDRGADRRDASLRWLLPVLRVSIAIMWIVSGVVSLGLYPVDASLRLLATVGITSEPLAYAALYGAAALDVALGVATIAMRDRRLLWLGQIAVVMAYTLIISIRLPHLWLEPFGPILKNLPVLALLWLLYVLERREWST
jgi:uncharacterized protein YbjT (DUF2867 family)